MTAITAILTKKCIAIATDSMITIYNPKNKEHIPKEMRKSKIIRLERLKAALSYYGLAEYGDFNTYRFIESVADNSINNETLEQFAQRLRDSLDIELNKIHFFEIKDKRLGIHLTGYEMIDGYNIPELFHLTNYNDTGDLVLSRETFKYISEEFKSEELDDNQKRIAVKNFLNARGLFIFNNGDSLLFNPLASAVLNNIQILHAGNKLRQPNDIETHRYFARIPIEVISKIQRKMCREGQKLVGGKTHDLVIDINGNFTSDSGD